MPAIIYVQADGCEKKIEVGVGQSLMQGAVQNGVMGIDAECGGACSCATCHAYIGEDWWQVTGEPGEDERDMLEFANEPGRTSRLTCQVKVSEAMEGMVVRLPASQG